MCTVPTCSYSCEFPTTLYSHVKIVHECASYGACGLSSCDFKTAYPNRMRRHWARMHDPLRGNILACLRVGCDLHCGQPQRAGAARTVARRTADGDPEGVTAARRLC